VDFVLTVEDFVEVMSQREQDKGQEEGHENDLTGHYPLKEFFVSRLVFIY
jgi:hypothetical protein